MNRFYEVIDGDNVIAIDTETTGLNWWKDRIFLISIAGGRGSKIIEVNKYTIKALGSELQELFLDLKIKKVFHNFKFDYHFLSKWGITTTDFEDTMLIERLLNNKQSVALKRLAKEYISRDADKWEKYLKHWKAKHKVPSYDLISREILYPYARKDAEYTYQLYKKHSPLLIGERRNLYDKEKELCLILTQIEKNGLMVDRKKWQKMKAQVYSTRKQLEQKLAQALGDINLNSSEQLIDAFLKIGVVFTKRTQRSKSHPQGQISTDKTALLQILQSTRNPVIKLLLDYRKVFKVESIYFTPEFLELLDGNVLHPNFSQTSQKIGRLACYNPNFQNIPKDTDLRAIFVARNRFWGFDFDQFELRIFSYFTKDKSLWEFFKNDKDFIKQIADSLKVERRIAKDITYGILYGMGIKGYAGRYRTSLSEAKQLFQTFHQSLPTLEELRSKVISTVVAYGSIKTPFGRVLNLSSDESYKGLNALIQSTAGDIAKFSLISLKKYLGQTVNLIHDEILFDGNLSEKDRLEIQKTMENQFEFPLKVGVKDYGRCWKII